MLTSRRWQMDPNDPNYDPDEDEPRRAPVDLHAGKDADVAAYKQAVRAPGACSNLTCLPAAMGLLNVVELFTLAAQVDVILEEYFSSADAGETATALQVLR